MATPADRVTTDAASAGNRKRPRHFHQGPNQQTEEEEEVTAAQPPTTRLYRHALESMFAFLSLEELGKVLAVSHSWMSAVSSMRSIDATIRLLIPPIHPLVQICASPLSRHIGCLESLAELDDESNLVPVNCDTLYLIALRMCNLHSLSFKLPSLVNASPLYFPPSLTNLKSEVLEDSSDADINLLIRAVSRIPKIQRLELDLIRLRPNVSFAPLQSCPNLRGLGLYLSDGSSFSPGQVDEIRTMPYLTHCLGMFHQLDMRTLMRLPHQLKWMALEVSGHLDGEMQALLASVPTLTEFYSESALDATFLSALPNVQTLSLVKFAVVDPLPSPEQLIEGVGQCHHLTHLTISDNDITTAEIRALLSCMPSLIKLILINMSNLESLKFLSTSAPLAHSLTHLELEDCRHPRMCVKELSYILSLKQLTHLNIVNCFSERMDSFTVDMWTQLPCAIMPKLIKSTISCADPEDEENDGE